MPRRKSMGENEIATEKRVSAPRKKRSAVEEAPAPIIQKQTRSGGKFVAVLVGVGVFVIGGAVFLGRTDHGVIDVNQAIELSNQTQRESGSAGVVQAIPQQFQNQVNGGLVPSDNQDVPQTEDASSTTTATTTNTVATTTATTTSESVVSDDGGTHSTSSPIQ